MDMAGYGDRDPNVIDSPRSGLSALNVLNTRLNKLIATVAISWIMLILFGFLYAEQAGLYSEPHVIAVLLQVVYETPFQPLFLVVVLTPMFVAAARSVSWLALASGGLMMLSVLLPHARFATLEGIDGAGSPSVLVGYHNSLFQLAGPGNAMPQFVSIVTLVLMGGMVAMFWQPRVGGIIGLLGVISMAFVWGAAIDEPPIIDGVPRIGFTDTSLQLGYYFAWAGAVIALVGDVLGQKLATGSGKPQHEVGSPEPSESSISPVMAKPPTPEDEA